MQDLKMTDQTGYCAATMAGRDIMGSRIMSSEALRQLSFNTLLRFAKASERFTGCPIKMVPMLFYKNFCNHTGTFPAKFYTHNYPKHIDYFLAVFSET